MPFITSTATVFALTVFSTISCFAAAIYVTAAKTDGYINTASRVIINDAINLLILVVHFIMDIFVVILYYNTIKN